MQINICKVISCVTAEFCQQCLNIKGSVILGITLKESHGMYLELHCIGASHLFLNTLNPMMG